MPSSKWIWEPSADWAGATNVSHFMRKLGTSTVAGFRRYSVEHLEEFWDAVMKEMGVEWFTPYTNVLDQTRGPEWARWFCGGKLNIAHNCLVRHARSARSSHPAVIGESEDGVVT